MQPIFNRICPSSEFSHRMTAAGSKRPVNSCPPLLTKQGTTNGRVNYRVKASCGRRNGWIRACGKQGARYRLCSEKGAAESSIQVGTGLLRFFFPEPGFFVCLLAKRRYGRWYQYSGKKLYFFSDHLVDHHSRLFPQLSALQLSRHFFFKKTHYHNYSSGGMGTHYRRIRFSFLQVATIPG